MSWITVSEQWKNGGYAFYKNGTQNGRSFAVLITTWVGRGAKKDLKDYHRKIVHLESIRGLQDRSSLKMWREIIKRRRVASSGRASRTNYYTRSGNTSSELKAKKFFPALYYKLFTIAFKEIKLLSARLCRSNCRINHLLLIFYGKIRTDRSRIFVSRV